MAGQVFLPCQPLKRPASRPPRFRLNRSSNSLKSEVTAVVCALATRNTPSALRIFLAFSAGTECRSASVSAETAIVGIISGDARSEVARRLPDANVLQHDNGAATLWDDGDPSLTRSQRRSDVDRRGGLNPALPIKRTSRTSRPTKSKVRSAAQAAGVKGDTPYENHAVQQPSPHCDSQVHDGCAQNGTLARPRTDQVVKFWLPRPPTSPPTRILAPPATL